MFDAVAPITVPPVVSNPAPPHRLWRLVNHRAAGAFEPVERAMDWLADDPGCRRTILFRRYPGELRMKLDGEMLLLRVYPLAGDGPLTWAEVCEIAGIAEAG